MSIMLEILPQHINLHFRNVSCHPHEHAVKSTFENNVSYLPCSTVSRALSASGPLHSFGSCHCHWRSWFCRPHASTASSRCPPRWSSGWRPRKPPPWWGASALHGYTPSSCTQVFLWHQCTLVRATAGLSTRKFIGVNELSHISEVLARVRHSVLLHVKWEI